MQPLFQKINNENKYRYSNAKEQFKSALISSIINQAYILFFFKILIRKAKV